MSSVQDNIVAEVLVTTKTNSNGFFRRSDTMSTQDYIFQMIYHISAVILVLLVSAIFFTAIRPVA